MPSTASSVQLAPRSKAASQRSIAMAATPATGEQPAAAAVEAPPRRLVTAVRERAHEKVAVPFVPVQLVCRDLRYYVPGEAGCPACYALGAQLPLRLGMCGAACAAQACMCIVGAPSQPAALAMQTRATARQRVW